MIERIKQEPVVFAGAIQTLILAVGVLASAFGWWEWTQEQREAVLAVWAGVTAIVTFAVRKQTVPAANVVDDDSII